MIEIDGYIHCIGDECMVEDKGYIESFTEGVFRRFLEKYPNVEMVWNHDKSHILARTEDKTLSLYEDAIGLRFRCKITDPEVIKKARAGLITGCSFGYWRTGWNDVVSLGKQNKRIVDDIFINEVTLTDQIPAYKGTTANIIRDYDLTKKNHDLAYKTLKRQWEIDKLRNATLEQRIINAEEIINVYARSR